ncbi:serine hydrolase [Pedobacter paludis]|uniref:Serine hydrolase n=2 Tax=Pedobacter paludis TaxID=2203212 RepID=A0A317F8K0_9SPHI|nr:serine hydrolase [Pedobacter paludis]
MVEKKMATMGMVGVGAAIIVNKKVVWQKGYGYADMRNKIPFTPETIMNIASISKVVTGACLMKAVELGKLSLDEDINNYLPFKIVNPYFAGEKITLRMLATHTSGLADRYPFYTDSTYFNGKDSPEALGDFLKQYFVPGGKYYTRENFLHYKPGTYRDYSNIGAGLAGYILELRTGEKLNDFSRRYIFKLLKMENTGWFLSEIDTGHHSKLYAKQGESIKEISLYGVTTYPDGGLRTSVSELSKFFIALLNHGVYKGIRILKRTSVDEMLRLQFTESNKPENVHPDQLNSGVFWATKMGGSRIGHNGSDPGVRTFMLSDLAKEIGIVLFVNTSLSEKEEHVYFDMYNELYKYAKTLEK